MSGYAELRELGVVFRPPDRPLPPDERRPSQFEASWTSTVNLLAVELRNLDAKRIAIELALKESDLRIDGLPRAGASLTADGIRIAFESKHGPLQYETATFTGRYYRGGPGWQQNIRAVALGLEALRKVDRYGISKRGEQYRGWKALPMGTDPADAIVTVEQAHAVICQYEPDGDIDDQLRAALMATHPDHGGDPNEFRKVTRAREILTR